jgi:hypothetical protein
MHAFISLLALLAGPTADATGDPASGAGVLAGLDRLHVEVLHLSEIVTESGLNDETLTREVSGQISRAGYVVLSASTYKPDTPFVALAIEAVELPQDGVAWHVSLELQEGVVLARDCSVSTFGSTWYTSTMGLSQAGNLAEEVPEVVSRLVDDFLADAASTRPSGRS